MHISVMEFFIEHIVEEEIRDKKILEVGSKYINGSVRRFIERFYPREYLGIDIEAGRFVDIVLPAERIVEYFGMESFDVVIATEFLEHVRDWRITVKNMKKVLKKGGYMYITTRSLGFPYHGYPYDFWRVELHDVKKIFADFEILKLIRDYEVPGVFLKARNLGDCVTVDLSNVSLYSIILRKRTKSVPNINNMPFAMKFMLRRTNTKISWLLPKGLLDFLRKHYS